MIKSAIICLLPIIILAVCVNANKTLSEKIPYCHSKSDYNCQVKINDVKSWYETFGDLSNSYASSSSVTYWVFFPFLNISFYFLLL